MGTEDVNYEEMSPSELAYHTMKLFISAYKNAVREVNVEMKVNIITGSEEDLFSVPRHVIAEVAKTLAVEFLRDFKLDLIRDHLPDIDKFLKEIPREILERVEIEHKEQTSDRKMIEARVPCVEEYIKHHPFVWVENEDGSLSIGDDENWTNERVIPAKNWKYTKNRCQN